MGESLTKKNSGISTPDEAFAAEQDAIYALPSELSACTAQEGNINGMVELTNTKMLNLLLQFAEFENVEI